MKHPSFSLVSLPALPLVQLLKEHVDPSLFVVEPAADVPGLDVLMDSLESKERKSTGGGGMNERSQRDERSQRGGGLNFASALRSFLRQDPDIIMVGEIRDFETAEIAVKAALTGHLVLSTLHTNDAPSSVSRMLNMGIEPFLVASSVNLIGAQRLVRKLCQDCKTPVDIPEETLVEIGVPPENVEGFQAMRGAGCRNCNNTGYKGRIAVYEIMIFNEEIREFVLNGASTMELKREAIRQGMKTLRMSALGKLEEGLTSLEEVVRATAPD